jgi:hypothetical protein
MLDNIGGVLIVLTKRKETIRYCKRSDMAATLSNIIANELMHVSVPIEDG